MSLWELIRDFFVQNVFGGVNSVGVYYYNTIGTDASSGSIIDTGNSLAPIEFLMDDNTTLHITYGDWLSTTATAISITIIVVLCCLFVYKIIKLIGGLIR